MDFAAALRDTVAPLEPQAGTLEALAAVCGLRVLKKAEHLPRIGDLAEHFYFLRSGLPRSYFLDPETGQERTGSSSTKDR